MPLCHITLPVVQSLVLSFGENGLCMLPLLTALLELAQEAAEAEVTLKGQLNLLRHPDYNSERARLLLGFLSQQELLTTMLASCSGGLRVLLGNESVRPELDGSSLIVTHYRGAGGASGTIGVIGPLRPTPTQNASVGAASVEIARSCWNPSAEGVMWGK